MRQRHSPTERSIAALRIVEAGPKKSAPEEYAKAAADVQKKLKGIDAAIKAHALKQAQKPGSFGFVGDMQHANEILGELLDFLTGNNR